MRQMFVISNNNIHKRNVLRKSRESCNKLYFGSRHKVEIGIKKTVADT